MHCPLKALCFKNESTIKRAILSTGVRERFFWSFICFYIGNNYCSYPCPNTPSQYTLNNFLKTVLSTIAKMMYVPSQPSFQNTSSFSFPSDTRSNTFPLYA